MGRRGKVGRKGNSRKRGWSNEAGSDDSDEDYVVSDEENSSSLDELASEEEDEDENQEEEDCPRVRNFSRSKPKNGIFGRRRNASKTPRKRGRLTYEDKEDEKGGEEEEEEEEKDEDEEEVQEENDDEYKAEDDDEYKVEDDDEYEEVEEVEEENDEDEENKAMGNFRRSKARNGVCGQPKNANKTSTNRRRIIFSEPLEEDEENKEEEDKKGNEEEEDEKFREEEEDKREKGVNEDEKDKEEEYEEKKVEMEADEVAEEEKVEMEGDEAEEEETGDEWKQEEEGDADEEDEDFDCDDDDEFTPDEDDYSDEEEEMRGRGKNNNSMRKGKKVSQKRTSVVSTRGRKKQSSGASKRSLRNKRRRNGRIRRMVKCDDEDDFIDNGPTIRKTIRKKLGRKRRTVVSDSDCVSSGSPDVEYTISEEEREQVREANELCAGSRINLRSSSLVMNNEEDGVHEDLHLQQKPPGWRGKEKIQEPQGRKGKEKVEDLKSEVAKQVCGICLSEETKRRVRGVLNCCTHYFCFACIMEWAKVESRCPLCKQRFTTISKPVRTTGVDLREVVIEVPERDQVYQPSEEELRSYIDPYEHVICLECHQGGDDGLMLLCDICDSPAHTYCVGLGREVPEGNWYCDGCRPVALGSSGSEVQECVAEQRVTIQSIPVRPPAIHVRESIDLNSMSSPRTGCTQAFGHHPFSQFTGRSVEGVSPVSGGAPTLSERRWIHRQIQQLLSMDRMTSTTVRTNVIPATSSSSNLYNSQIDQSREIASEHAITQDVGTSYHTFFEETLCNNTSPLIQNGALWPGLVDSTLVLDCERIHQFSRLNNVIDDSLSSGVREECNNFHIAKEQLQSMVKNHLKSLSQNIDLGHDIFMDIARSSMHTILAACGLEHMKSEVFSVPPPSICSHIELSAGGRMSLIKGCCSSCFDSFVGDVVKRILDSRFSSHWLRLGL